MKRGGGDGEIDLKRRIEIVLASEHEPLETTMWTNIKNAIRRADERNRHRREYADLLQQGDQMFSDIGVARADVEKLFRQTRIRLF
jgi:uncharacterized protein YjiS (DUF1127 family)